jgi:cytochrome c5
MSDEHEAFIKTPRQLIIVVVLAFVVPITVMIMLAKYMNSSVRDGAGADTMTAESVEARIRPVAHFELVDASAPRKAASGEDVYKAQCSACHAAGVAGAPKFGDKAAWSDRIKTGLEALAHSALKGKGAMPPQGGGQFNDNEIAHAVVYMANAAGANFEAPKAEEAPKTAEAAGAAPGAAAPAPSAAAAMPAAPGAAAPVTAASTAVPAPAAPAPAAAPAPGASAAAPAPEAPAAGSATATAASAADLAAGKKINDTTCFVCHATGVAGAPKYGDKASWEPFLKTGIDTMVKNAITGIRAMPPRGGNAKLSDSDMHAAVEYMAAAAR